LIEQVDENGVTICIPVLFVFDTGPVTGF